MRVEGFGFTGAEIRRSFELASRACRVDMIYYDNGGNADKALGNAEDAVVRKVDLLIEYNSDAEANAEIGRQLKAAGIPGTCDQPCRFLARRFTPPMMSRPAGSPAKPLENSPGRTGRIRRRCSRSSATSAT